MRPQTIDNAHEVAFDPRLYWEQRLAAHPDITGVGHVARSSQFVQLQYRSRVEQLERALRQYGLTNLAHRSVLDVGAGTGIWLDFWKRHGAEQVVGLDFAQPSVDWLRKQFPQQTIVQADLTVSPLPLSADCHFDIISAFDVLLHIVTPDGFQRAIANLARHCAPGGWLLVFDAIVQGQGYVPGHQAYIHNKVRQLAEYRTVLEANGFLLQAVRPVNVLLNTPLEAPNRLAFWGLSANWKASRFWGRSRLLCPLLSPGMLAAERLACRLFAGAPPGSKMLVARKVR